MDNSLNTVDIEKLESLAKLKLNMDEKTRITEEIKDFVRFCAILDKYETAPLTVEETGVGLREDIPCSEKNDAPAPRFSVPQTIMSGE